jgi:excinuclease UvrABC helicase subunit UvrB
MAAIELEKKFWVEYGFRLPSAMGIIDLSPFDEFES